jgi:hypothetical protein
MITVIVTVITPGRGAGIVRTPAGEAGRQGSGPLRFQQPDDLLQAARCRDHPCRDRCIAPVDSRQDGLENRIRVLHQNKKMVSARTMRTGQPALYRALSCAGPPHEDLGRPVGLPELGDERAGEARLRLSLPSLRRLYRGEPLLQVDAPLLAAVKARGFETAVETNGTQSIPDAVDWVCISPKVGAPLRSRRGDELKLVYPQPGLDPASLTDLEFRHFWLQPMDGPEKAANTAAAIAYCQKNPHWRLGLQTHKLIGIP